MEGSSETWRAFHGLCLAYISTNSFSALLRRTAFVATIIEEMLIRSADISGLKEIPKLGYKTPAATGMASIL